MWHCVQTPRSLCHVLWTVSGSQMGYTSLRQDLESSAGNSHNLCCPSGVGEFFYEGLYSLEYYDCERDSQLG